MVQTDIDFEKPGKQVGYIDLPHSPHEDAWGALRVPLCVMKNGSGPSVLMQGGNHGDEYEGPIVLGEVIRELDPEEIQGRLIIVPAINLPALEAGSRVSPLDGLNFNRTFPGEPFGSITEQLSAFVHDMLFPMADVFMDLHSGGSSLAILPSAIIEPCKNPALATKIRNAVMAFGAPMNVVINNFGDPRTSTASAVKAGLITIGTEMGGGGTVSPHALNICRKGVYNVLRHFGVIATKDKAEPPKNPTLFHEMEGRHAYVRASETGVFEPFHGLGDRVEAGQPAGRIHFLSNPGRKPVTLAYGASGILYGLRQPGRVRPGNCCAVVASPQHRQAD